MKKGSRWLALAGAVVLMAGLLAIAWRPEREPMYHGKALSHWVLEGQKNGWRLYPPEPAVEAVRSMGTNGIPYLVRWAVYETPPLKRMVFGLAAKLIRSKAIQDRRARRADAACDALRILGGDARVAVPALARVAQECAGRQRQERAVWALGFLGEQALDALLEIARNPTNELQTTALEVIQSRWELGTNRARAVPMFIECTTNKSEYVASLGVRGLSNIRDDPGRAVPALRVALRHASPFVRLLAAATLAEYGSAAVEAEPELQAGLTDPDPAVRKASKAALARVKGETPEGFRSVAP